MTQHNNQRVAVLVDVQNMYYSAKNLHEMKVNFSNILKTAVAGRRLVRAIAYVIRADVKDEHNFHEALDKIGFEVRSKDLQTFVGGAKKGDWDVGIAMDAIRLAPKVDTLVLVSGDGDFCDLLQHLKTMGCRAEIISFRKTTNSKLVEIADNYVDLDTDRKRYLIPLKPAHLLTPEYKYKTFHQHETRTPQTGDKQLLFITQDLPKQEGAHQEQSQQQPSQGQSQASYSQEPHQASMHNRPPMDQRPMQPRPPLQQRPQMQPRPPMQNQNRPMENRPPMQSRPPMQQRGPQPLPNFHRDQRPFRPQGSDVIYNTLDDGWHSLDNEPKPAPKPEMKPEPRSAPETKPEHREEAPRKEKKEKEDKPEKKEKAEKPVKKKSIGDRLKGLVKKKE